MTFNEEELNSLYRYASVLSHHDDMAYDLVHDIVVKLSSKFAFNKMAYAKRSIRNQYYDQLGKAKRERIENDYDFIIENRLELDAVNKDELKHYMGKVSAEIREILYMLYVEEYSYKEVSAFLNINMNTLLSFVRRFKINIKEEEL